MSDLMLHGVLNMPLPDDPAELDIVTWTQFRDRARQAGDEITRLRAQVAALKEAAEIVLADIEGVIAEEGERSGTVFSMREDAKAIRAIDPAAIVAKAKAPGN